MKFVIPRERWMRGKSSCLYDPDTNTLCCVGLYLEALGVPIEEMTLVRSAHSKKLKGLIPEEAKWLLREGYEDHILASEAADQLYGDNDTYRLDEHQREDAIAEGFMLGGRVEVEFK